MPIEDGGAAEGGRGIDTTSGREKRTIREDVIGAIRHPADLMRNSNNIYSLAKKTGYHIDALQMVGGEYDGLYKVDIQRAGGNKDTVAQIMLAGDVQSLEDVQDALEQSLEIRHKFIVTR